MRCTTNHAGVAYAGGFTCAILPNSLGAVPDGGGRYAAVETGADNTRNHVLTTPITYEVTYPSGGLVEVPSLSWEVTSNDPSDVFNVWAQVMWSGQVGADLQVLGIADGLYSSAFGYGLDFSQSTQYQVCTFFGSCSGLAAGVHNLTLYFFSPNNGNITIASNYSQYGLLQQISS